jgi:hypothetical protein
LALDGVPPRPWAAWVADALEADLTVRAQSGAPASVVAGLLDDLPDERWDVALVFVGTNDAISWRHYRHNTIGSLDAILHAVASRSDRVLVMQLSADAGRHGWALWPYGPGLRRRVRRVRQETARLAAEHGALLVEQPRLAGSQVWVDRIHPTSTGHLAMADAALAALGEPSASSLASMSVPRRGGWYRFRAQGHVKFALKTPVTGVGGWLLAR